MTTKHSLDLRNRRATFAGLEAQTFDVLIIGAGITGCGVARDAAMRGLSVALVDAADIGAGTSSRSSKLIHGGLRYLAQGDMFVVKEAAIERRAVRATAPHLAQIMPMVIPVRGKKGMAQMRAAMWTYEKLGQVPDAEKHEIWEPDRLKAEEPSMLTDGLYGAVVYPECITDDFRLTLANARSAADHGAVVATYARAEEFFSENGKCVGALVASELPGEGLAARVRARVIVNAAGPWVDAIRRMEDPTAKKKLQLTRGIHLIVRRERLPINRTIIMTASDKRGNFAVPRDSYVYIGTTDTFHADPEYWPEITREDIDYLLGPVNETFDIDPITGADIVAAWAGIRPLLGAEGKRKPSEISRRHEIMEGRGGVLTVAGGKLTSYRSMAERVADKCEKRMGRKKPSPALTADTPLPGGDFTESVDGLRSRIEALGLESAEAGRAARLYGSEALEIFAEENTLRAEIRHAVECEGALTLEDYWVRRSARARFEVDEDDDNASLTLAAEHMGGLMNWSDDEEKRQIEHCQNLRDEELKALI